MLTSLPAPKPLSVWAATEFTRWVREKTLAALRERIELYREFGAADQHEIRRWMDETFQALADGSAEAFHMQTPEGRAYLYYLATTQSAGPSHLQVAQSIPFLDSAKAVDAVGQASSPEPPAPEAVFAPDPPRPQPAPDRLTEIKAQRARRAGIFAKMCALANIDAKGLMELPIEDAVKLWCDVTMDQPDAIDRLKLKARIVEYAEAPNG